MLTACGGGGETSPSNRTEYDERNLSAQEYAQYNLAATDALGRSFGPVDEVNESRYVGMFYFLWSGAHDVNRYDVNWLLENAPDDLWSLNADKSRGKVYHYWGEPLFGYYDNLDEWVITRHVEMLTTAGIDFLGLDVTNGLTYDDRAQLLFDTLVKFAAQGFDVPKITFITNTGYKDVVKHVYDTWYQNPVYDSIWFRPDGKPMIVTNLGGWTDAGDDLYVNYFDMKEVLWPNGPQSPEGFPWMDFHYPQEFHYLSGAMSVSVAQHNSVAMSNQENGNRGRSFNVQTMSHDPSRVNYGDNYANQWQTVYNEKGVRFAFVTGWNEWIAIKQTTNGKVSFVDEFNTDFSRDIEPMKGGYGDNYYMQTIAAVRQWKGREPYHYKYVNHSDCLDPDSPVWNDVPAYADFEGDAIARDHNGTVKGDDDRYIRYTDNSNRNDIVSVQVASDGEYLCFRVETAADVTAPQGENWMNILINVKSNTASGFNGYNFVLNKNPDLAGGTSEISRFTGSGYQTVSAGTAELAVSGRYLTVRVRLSALGLSDNDRHIEFKVTDNITVQDDMSDYYVSGDSAPIGRTAFAYGF